MIKQLLGIVAAIASIFFCTVLPFLPGRYEALAVPVSAMAQAVGIVGLVLVPFGLLWILADRSSRLVQKRVVFAGLALVASLMVWFGVFVVAVVHSGYTLGFLIFALWVFFLYRAWLWLKRSRGATAHSPSALPFYLVIVPVVVVVLQYALFERVVEFSRNRAILNSAPLIAAIEQYRRNNGRYPTSLHTVQPDYLPGVIGVERYRYEPHGEAYNLFFEQFSHRFGTQEFVVYNPRDEQVMTVHAMDLLEMTPEQLALDRTRGHYAVNDASQPHWKYFWFD